MIQPFGEFLSEDSTPERRYEDWAVTPPEEKVRLSEVLQGVVW